MSYQPYDRSQYAIAKNTTRYFIEGDCIPGVINLDGKVLDVSKHYVRPKSLPIPILVEGDYMAQTGIVTKLIPNGDVLRFEGEIFNADTRMWSSDPLSAIWLGELTHASVKSAPSSGGYGFTVESVHLHSGCIFRGAQVDRLWRKEPWVKIHDPTFRLIHEMYVSDRVKARRAKEKEVRALMRAKEQGRKEALAELKRGRGK